MVKTLIAISAAVLVALAPSLSAGKPKDTDTDQSEIRLNKHQLAAVAVVLAEMRRRGHDFRHWQMKITDEGKSYEIAFLEDPLNMAVVGGEGMSWKVRKSDLHLSGPTFYR